MIKLEVLGIPKAQPRPRAASRGGHAVVYNPKTANEWKQSIRLSAVGKIPEEPIIKPVSVEILYYMPRPKRLMRKNDPAGTIPHTKKPDIDNLNKAVFDTLVDVGILKDDNIIFRIKAEKLYHGKGCNPGAEIQIRILNFVLEF